MSPGLGVQDVECRMQGCDLEGFRFRRTKREKVGDLHETFMKPFITLGYRVPTT